MKIFQTADWHARNDEGFFKSLKYLVEKAKEHKPDAVTVAGDLFDRAMLNSESSGFVRLQKHIKEILDVCPIWAIEGTPTHDVKGSLKILENTTGLHSFKIMTPGKWYSTFGDNKIVGIPELNKSFFLADNPTATDEEISELFKKFLFNIAVTKPNGCKTGVLCHCEIKGAKLTEKQVLPQGSLSLSEHDLMSIGADFYSIGHIHMRQDINEKIRYEGSIDSKDWGERTKKGFTVLNINGDEITKETIYFPTPTKEKLELTDITEAAYHVDNLPTGTMLWCDIKMSEQEYKAMTKEDVERDLELLLSYGYHPESRITYNVTRAETTRAAEIVNKKTLFDKLSIWVDNSKEEMPDDVKLIKEKCQHYDDQVKAAGLVNEPKSLQLLSVDIRGAIGIWKGQKSENKIINFEDIESGIVALLGDNGKGKSTLIKNCNPYPDAIDGGVGLKNGFYLKDSHSITVWVDKLTNVKYKAVKRINADIKSGKTEYFMYINKGSDWELYNVDQSGRKDAYEKAVLEVFGSKEVFKRSVYIAQKGSSLPATVSERKELFNELLNQYIQPINDLVKVDLKELTEKRAIVENKINPLTEMVIDETEVKKSINTSKSELKEAKDKQVTIELEGKDLNKQLAGLNTKKEKRDSLEVDLKLNDAEIKNLNTTINSLNDNIKNLESLLLNKDDFEKEIADNKVIVDKIAVLNQKLEGFKQQQKELVEEQNKIIDDYNTAVSDQQAEKEKLNKSIEDDEKEISHHSESIKGLQNIIDSLNNACPQCGFMPIDNIAKINLSKSDIEYKRSKCISVQERINEHNKKLFKLQNEVIETPSFPSVNTFFKKIDEIIKEIETLESELKSDDDIDELKASLVKVKLADEQLKKYQTELVSIEEKRVAFQVKNCDLKSSLDQYADLNTEIENTEKKLSETREIYQNISTTIVRYESDIKHLNEKLEANDEIKIKISTLRAELKNLDNMVAVLNLIESGTSKKGIQALELDALAPTIINTANKLINRIYGEKFSLSIETTRETKTGEQVEDFEFVVTDNEEENPKLKDQKLSTLSGGEEVWILKAIYDAISITRENNTGLKYLTTFQDEADGALSPEKKHLYLQMIDATHNESGREHTVYVTHDQSIQQSINARIQL